MCRVPYGCMCSGGETSVYIAALLSLPIPTVERTGFATGVADRHYLFKQMLLSVRPLRLHSSQGARTPVPHPSHRRIIPWEWRSQADPHPQGQRCILRSASEWTPWYPCVSTEDEVANIVSDDSMWRVVWMSIPPTFSPPIPPTSTSFSPPDKQHRALAERNGLRGPSHRISELKIWITAPRRHGVTLLPRQERLMAWRTTRASAAPPSPVTAHVMTVVDLIGHSCLLLTPEGSSKDLLRNREEKGGASLYAPSVQIVLYLKGE
jgi:hypothetical protein